MVTHHVTAMVVQAEAARYLTRAPERLDETLNAVTDTGRRAIADLRHLLDLLDPGHDTAARTPSLRELRTLVEQTRQAGQPVELTEEGTPSEIGRERRARRLPGGAGGPDERPQARPRQPDCGPRALRRRGRSPWRSAPDGSGLAGARGSPGGSGRGLVGLRERVDALGGEFSADRRADGGFVVRARIPAGSRA